MTAHPPTHSPPSTPDTGREAASRQDPATRVPWRAAGIGLTSLAAPAGIAAAAPLLGEIAAAVELAVMLTIIGTALFGSQALSDRAFRLLRWLGNRPEPPAIAPSPPPVAAP